MRKSFLLTSLIILTILSYLFVKGLENYSNSTANPLHINNKQLDKSFIFEDYEYVLVQRHSLNIPIVDSTEYTGIFRREITSTAWEEYIVIRSKPDSAKNNPYELWYKDGLQILIVDQNGAGSGEGIGKIISVNHNTIERVKCFYYTPEDPRHLESLLAKPDHLSDADCQNYSVEIKE